MRLINILLSFIYLLPFYLYSNENRIDFNRWIFLFTPISGETNIDLKIPFLNVQNNPQSQQPAFLVGEKKLSGKDKGYGYQFLAIKKNWQILNVGFHFPSFPNSDSNLLIDYYQNAEAKVSGNILVIRHTWQNSSLVDPFIIFTHFYGFVESKIQNFLLYNQVDQNWLQYPILQAKIITNEPEPQIGFQFKIPIQNWRFDIFYSYSFEQEQTNVKTSYGTLNSYTFTYLFDFYSSLYQNIYAVQSHNYINPVEVSIKNRYYGSKIGVSLFLDYQRFISIGITFKKDLLNRKRIFSNLIFNFIFSNYGGISIYYDYNFKRGAKIQNLLVGPSFIFQF